MKVKFDVATCPICHLDQWTGFRPQKLFVILKFKLKFSVFTAFWQNRASRDSHVNSKVILARLNSEGYLKLTFVAFLPRSVPLGFSVVRFV